jgi:Protein of unknown function (DUF4199)
MAILDNPQEDLNTANVPFMPTAQKWGLYLTAGSIIFTILLSLIGFNFTSMGSFLMYSLLIFVVAIGLQVTFGVLTIREHRTNLGGFIDFKQAFIVCFAAFMISLVLGSAFNFVYNTYINPAFMDGMKDSMNTMFDEMSVPEANREEAMKGIEAGKTIAGTLKNMVSGAVLSALVAAIMAAIMKKARPMF